jgi:hypothetical protein
VLIELRPEQQQILERAVRSGMSPEEVLNQASAIVDEQLRNEEWLLVNKEAISAQI